MEANVQDIVRNARKLTLGSLSGFHILEQLSSTCHMFALLLPALTKRRNLVELHIDIWKGSHQRAEAAAYTCILFSKSSTDHCIKLNSGFSSSSPTATCLLFKRNKNMNMSGNSVSLMVYSREHMYDDRNPFKWFSLK